MVIKSHSTAKVTSYRYHGLRKLPLGNGHINITTDDRVMNIAGDGKYHRLHSSMIRSLLSSSTDTGDPSGNIMEAFYSSQPQCTL